MKPFVRYTISWIALSVASVLSIQLSFLIYTRINPKIYGFMGDETPYGFEMMGLGILMVFYVFVDLGIASIWQNRDFKSKLRLGILVFVVKSLLSLGLLLFFYFPRESLWGCC